MLMMDEGWVTT